MRGTKFTILGKSLYSLTAWSYIFSEPILESSKHTVYIKKIPNQINWTGLPHYLTKYHIKFCKKLKNSNCGSIFYNLKKKWRKLYKTSQKTIQCNVVTLTFQKNTNNNVFYLNNSSCEPLPGNQKSIYYYYYYFWCYNTVFKIKV